MPPKKKKPFSKEREREALVLRKLHSRDPWAVQGGAGYALEFARDFPTKEQSLVKKTLWKNVSHWDPTARALSLHALLSLQKNPPILAVGRLKKNFFSVHAVEREWAKESFRSLPEKRKRSILAGLEHRLAQYHSPGKSAIVRLLGELGDLESLQALRQVLADCRKKNSRHSLAHQVKLAIPVLEKRLFPKEIGRSAA